jgi:hypothetical protein
MVQYRAWSKEGRAFTKLIKFQSEDEARTLVWELLAQDRELIKVFRNEEVILELD